MHFHFDNYPVSAYVEAGFHLLLQGISHSGVRAKFRLLPVLRLGIFSNGLSMIRIGLLRFIHLPG